MSLLGRLTVDVAVVIALALGAAWLLRRRSAATRHWILATAVMCAAAMPVFEAAAPAWSLPAPAWLSPTATSALTLTSDPAPHGTTAAVAQHTVAAAATPALLDQPELVIAGLWLAGAAIALAMLLAGLARLARLGRRAHVVREGAWADAAADAARAHGLRRPILLLQSEHPSLVLTWGLLRPRVLLPASARDWSDDRLRIVLSHELAHVRRGDWCLQILASLLECVYWFNPLVWYACCQLRLESERACDDAVLSKGITGGEYAAHLLAVARDAVRARHAWTPANAIASPSTLEGRIRAMLNAGLNRAPLTAPVRYATLLALGAFTAVIAGAAVSATSPATATAVIANDVALAVAPLPQLQIEKPLPPAGTSRPAVVPDRAPITTDAAQGGPAIVTGALYDQLGGYLPGVQVQLWTTNGNAYRGVTDRTGQFEFRDLPAGTYRLTATLPGFVAVTVEMTLAAGTSIVRSITMPIGSLQETVTVRCSAAPRDATPAPPPAQGGRGGPPPAGGRGAVPFSGGMGGTIRTPSQTVRVNPTCPSILTSDTQVVVAARIGIDGYLADVRALEGVSNQVVNRVVQSEVEVFDNQGRRRVVPVRRLETRIWQAGAQFGPPEPEFVESALNAVRQWQYTPTLLNGVPVEVNLTVTIAYTR